VIRADFDCCANILIVGGRIRELMRELGSVGGKCFSVSDFQWAVGIGFDGFARIKSQRKIK